MDDVDLDLVRQFIVRRELAFKDAVEASDQWIVVDTICTLLVFRVTEQLLQGKAQLVPFA